MHSRELNLRMYCCDSISILDYRIQIVELELRLDKNYSQVPAVLNIESPCVLKC